MKGAPPVVTRYRVVERIGRRRRLVNCPRWPDGPVDQSLDGVAGFVAALPPRERKRAGLVAVEAGGVERALTRREWVEANAMITKALRTPRRKP